MTDPPRAITMAAAAEPRARTLDGLMRQLHRIAAPTTSAASVERLLHELAKRGPAAVSEIARFLRGGDDVDLVEVGAADAVGHRTLRHAVLDVLGTIGGADAVAIALEQLPRSADPTELVILAHVLDAQDPGLHRERVIEAADDLLQRVAHATPDAPPPDVAPLFDLLRSYGGEHAVASLERCAREWPAYAFIALASMPDGAGIPSLVAFAADTDPTIVEPRLTYRVLAQASVQYPDAGDALVELARAGWISDDTWGAIADALAGHRLQFSPTMPDGTPPAERSATRRTYYVEWLNMRYEDDVTTGSWSSTQVDAQVALLERLADVASSPAAVVALRQARASLDRLRDGDATAMPQS